MGVKKIAILGGGISGLATLHFLKKRYGNDVAITLYEATPAVGGNIRSEYKDGYLFETAANGFYDNIAATQELIEDLNLTAEVIHADFLSKRRYIQHKGKLHLLPLNPMGLLASSFFSFADKWYLINGLRNNSVSKDQSIYNYISQRFSPSIASKIVDPFLRGISGGDIRKLYMRYAFPKMRKGNMISFKRGMQQLIDALHFKYQDHIVLEKRIDHISTAHADYVISTVPAYEAADIVEYDNLKKIEYCPMTVVGLGFRQTAFTKKPDGFGYLIPTTEGKEVMGVLFESNVYAHRAPDGCVMLRVMLSGIHGESDAIDRAIYELNKTYGVTQRPEIFWVKAWPKAIPQYDMIYASFIEDVPTKQQHLSISGNFIGGIAFNDCVNNAKGLANSINV